MAACHRPCALLSTEVAPTSIDPTGELRMGIIRARHGAEGGAGTQRWRSREENSRAGPCRAGAGVEASAGKHMCGITVNCGVVHEAAATALGNKFVDTIGSNSLYGVDMITRPVN